MLCRRGLLSKSANVKWSIERARRNLINQIQNRRNFVIYHAISLKFKCSEDGQLGNKSSKFHNDPLKIYASIK